MRVLCGHLCHHFGLRPPLLSILQSVYVFSRRHLGTVTELPADVWDELWVARAMVPSSAVDVLRHLAETPALLPLGDVEHLGVTS